MSRKTERGRLYKSTVAVTYREGLVANCEGAGPEDREGGAS